MDDETAGVVGKNVEKGMIALWVTEAARARNSSCVTAQFMQNTMALPQFEPAYREISLAAVEQSVRRPYLITFSVVKVEWVCCRNLEKHLRSCIPAPKQSTRRTMSMLVR